MHNGLVVTSLHSGGPCTSERIIILETLRFFSSFERRQRQPYPHVRSQSVMHRLSSEATAPSRRHKHTPGPLEGEYVVLYIK